MIGEHLAQPCTGNIEPIFFSMRTGLARRHAVTFMTVKRDVDLQRFDD